MKKYLPVLLAIGLLSVLIISAVKSGGTEKVLTQAEQTEACLEVGNIAKGVMEFRQAGGNMSEALTKFNKLVDRAKGAKWVSKIAPEKYRTLGTAIITDAYGAWKIRGKYNKNAPNEFSDSWLSECMSIN